MNSANCLWVRRPTRSLPQSDARTAPAMASTPTTGPASHAPSTQSRTRSTTWLSSPSRKQQTGCSQSPARAALVLSLRRLSLHLSLPDGVEAGPSDVVVLGAKGNASRIAAGNPSRIFFESGFIAFEDDTQRRTLVQFVQQLQGPFLKGLRLVLAPRRPAGDARPQRSLFPRSANCVTCEFFALRPTVLSLSGPRKVFCKLATNESNPTSFARAATDSERFSRVPSAHPSRGRTSP